MKIPAKVLLLLTLTTLVISAWAVYLMRLPGDTQAKTQTVRTRGKPAPSERLANGIAVRIDHLSEEQEEILTFLDAHATRITLDDVPTNRRFDLALVIRRRGKPDFRQVCLSVPKPTAHQEYLICLMPAGPQPYSPDKLKIIVQSKTDIAMSGTTKAYMALWQEALDNPFKDCPGTTATPVLSDDKTGVILMMGEKGNSAVFPTVPPDAEVRFEVVSQAAPAVAARTAPIAR